MPFWSLQLICWHSTHTMGVIITWSLQLICWHFTHTTDVIVTWSLLTLHTNEPAASLLPTAKEYGGTIISPSHRSQGPNANTNPNIDNHSHRNIFRDVTKKITKMDKKGSKVMREISLGDRECLFQIDTNIKPTFTIKETPTYCSLHKLYICVNYFWQYVWEKKTK